MHTHQRWRTFYTAHSSTGTCVAQALARQLLALALVSHEGGRTQEAWLHELNLLSEAWPLADTVRDRAMRSRDERLMQAGLVGSSCRQVELEAMMASIVQTACGCPWL